MKKYTDFFINYIILERERIQRHSSETVNSDVLAMRLTVVFIEIMRLFLRTIAY